MSKFRTEFINLAKEIFNSEPLAAEKKSEIRDRLTQFIANQTSPYSGTKERITTLSSSLNAGRPQEDSAEFLGILLDSILPQENLINEKSVTNQLLFSTKSESSNSSKDIHSKIYIPFQGSNSSGFKFSEMLSFYQKKEEMNSPLTRDKTETEIEEDKSKKKTATEEAADIAKRTIGKYLNKTLSLTTRNPNCEIVLSVRRFISENKASRKRSDAVEFDSINMNSETGKTITYEPTAFIVHQGSSVHGGHYVAYVKEKTGSTSEWYQYNDSTKSKVTSLTTGLALPTEASQAYVVKYSPVRNKSSDGPDRYITGLPPSQGNQGIINGGNRCWANAAFTFLMSMNSLYEKELTTNLAETKKAPEPDSKKDTVFTTALETKQSSQEKDSTTLQGSQLTTNLQLSTTPTNSSPATNSNTAISSVAANVSTDATQLKNTLTSAITRSKGGLLLTDEEAGAIMLIAIKNNGISNKQDSFKEDLQILIDSNLVRTAKSPEKLRDAALTFSAAFQKNAEAQKILPGENNLSKLDPSFAGHLLKDKYQAICDKFGIAKVVKAEAAQNVLISINSPHEKELTFAIQLSDPEKSETNLTETKKTPEPDSKKDTVFTTALETKQSSQEKDSTTLQGSQLTTNLQLSTTPTNSSPATNSNTAISSVAANVSTDATQLKNTLTSAITRSKGGLLLTDEEAGAIMLIAIKNNGISNKQDSFKEDLQILIDSNLVRTAKSPEKLRDAALTFSAAFQKNAEAQKILPGENNLSKLDPSFAGHLLKDKYQAICDKFGIAKVVKDGETASTSIEPTSHKTFVTHPLAHRA